MDGMGHRIFPKFIKIGWGFVFLPLKKCQRSIFIIWDLEMMIVDLCSSCQEYHPRRETYRVPWCMMMWSSVQDGKPESFRRWLVRIPKSDDKWFVCIYIYTYMLFVYCFCIMLSRCNVFCGFKFAHWELLQENMFHVSIDSWMQCLEACVHSRLIDLFMKPSQL